MGTPLSTYRPEVVDKDVENAQDGDEDDGAPLGLETNNDHHAGNETDHDNRHATNAPLAGEDEANEQENEQHATGELEVHLAVLLVELGQAGGRELFADPAVGQDHEQAAHDTQVAQEEVEVEDQAVAEKETHGLQIDRRARHQLANLLAVEERQLEALEVAVHAVAQVELDTE